VIKDSRKKKKKKKNIIGRVFNNNRDWVGGKMKKGGEKSRKRGFEGKNGRSANKIEGF